MSTQHTPGPWHICRDNPVMVRDSDDTLIADCDNFQYTDDGEIQLPDCEANARLIAAAPDLLGALEKIARDAMALASDPVMTDRAHFYNIGRDAEKAIAKARREG